MTTCKRPRCDRPVTGPGDDLCWWHRMQEIFAEQRRDRLDRFRVMALSPEGEEVEVPDPWEDEDASDQVAPI